MRKNFLSENLIFLRNQRGLKQSEIQNLTGYKRNTWSNWENGKSEPNIDNILEIAHFFDTDPGKLIFEDLSKDDLTEQNIILRETKKRNPKSVLTDHNSVDQMEAVRLKKAMELAHQEIMRKNEIIHQKDDTIEALRGQVEALKLATDLMEAKKIGQSKRSQKAR